MVWATMLVLGAVAGVLAGLFGIGGGLILVPALVYLFGYSQHMANGTSLVALLLPVGIFGVMEYYRMGRIGPENIKLGLMIAVGMFVGTYFGARLAVALPAVMLRKAFCVFLVMAAVRLFFKG